MRSNSQHNVIVSFADFAKLKIQFDNGKMIIPTK
jgi:hypothetical protein